MKGSLRIRYPENISGESNITLRTVAKNPESNYNDYLQRLVKLIPGEAIGIYLTAKNILESKVVCDNYQWLPFVGLIILLVVRVLGTRVKTENRNVSIEWPLVIISMISYFIWIYAIGDCILGFDQISQQVVAIVVLIWTFLVPYIYKP